MPLRTEALVGVGGQLSGRAGGNKVLQPLEGLRDVSTRWVVIHAISEWREEIAWMSLYLSAAVRASLALCVFYAAEGHIAG